jgi:ribose transport system substrate-binding protein
VPVWFRGWMAMVLLVPMACGAAACSRDQGTARPRVALVMKSLANEFFKTMADGAVEHQRQHAGEYDLVVNGIKDELDVARQIDIVEQMIAERVSAIVLAPADSRALVPVTRRAIDAGIVVVNIDNRFDAAVLRDQKVSVPFVGPDNRKGARLVGEAIAARLAKGDAVAILEGAPNAFNGIQRKLGFEDAIAAAGLTLVTSQTGNWESAIANQVASAILTEHPEVKALLCANDSMALGAVAAVKAAGREGGVLVAGFDNISAVRQLIRSGAVLATADQHGDQLAVFGIEYAREMLSRKAAPSDHETPVDLITAANLK